METYSEYLQHHGIPGMHWGERNGPPYPLRPMQYTKEELREKKKAASGYNKELRKAQNHKYRKADIIKTRWDEKYKKRVENIDKYATSEEEKVTDKKRLDDYYANSKRYQKAAERVQTGNDKVKEILERAELDGLTLEQTKQYGLSNAGNVGMWTSAITGVAGLGPLPVAVIMSVVDSNRKKKGLSPLFTSERTDKYRVKVDEQYKEDVKKNEQTIKELKKDAKNSVKQNPNPNTSWYDKSGHLTEIGKQEKINRAKEKDLWNLDFLEAVQNYDLPKNVMLKEYERFLNSGESYSDYANDDMDKRLRKYAER